MPSSRRHKGRGITIPFLARLSTALIAASLSLAPAAAQIPPPPFAYIRGTDIGRDTVSNSKFLIPKGTPDVWLRISFRNLGYYLHRPGWGIFVKHLILRTKNGPYHQWDTLVGSRYPLLEVELDGNKVNRSDGSIAGFSPPEHVTADLLIADDGTVASRHTPLEIEIGTLDGTYTVPVAPYNMWDNKPQ